MVCGLRRPCPEWDLTVLFETVGLADMIAVHNYFGRPVFKDSMAANLVFQQMIDALDKTIDEACDTALGVHARTHRELGSPPVVKRRPGIALDEWNVWYRATHDPKKDLEEVYNYMDAVTLASLMQVVLRNTRAVTLSNISEAVNMCASILTDRNRMVRQTIWYTQKLMRDAHDRGRVLGVAVDGPAFAAKHERFFCGIVSPEKAKDDTLPSLLHFDEVPAVDVVASVDEARHRLVVSVVQKLEHDPVDVTLHFSGGVSPKGRQAVWRTLSGGRRLKVENTLDHPDRIGLECRRVPVQATYTFPPASVTVLEFAC